MAPCETSSPWVVDASTHATQAAYQTTSSYDSAADLVSVTISATSSAPSGATTTLTYDPAGNKVTSTDPNGVTTTWTYTPPGQPATISYSGSSAHLVSYGYDANGKTTAMTDATGSSSYVYDPFGELTLATNGAGQVTGYAYLADGQVSSIAYPLPSGATWATSNTVSYTYDNADMRISVTDFNGNRISIANTANGLTSSLTLGSTGDLINTTYDNADMPSLIKLKNSSSTLQSFNYTDSPSGAILNEADTPTSSQSPAVYTYDGQGRVASMTPGSGSTMNYGVDVSSNLTTLPGGAVGSYDHAGELISAVLGGTTTTYTYNADGQQLSTVQGSNTMASGYWNGAGRLIAYSDASANMTGAAYDGNGVRSTATTSSGTQNFVWNTVAAISQVLMDSANAYIYATSGTPAEQVNLTTGTVAYIVHDWIGSVRGIVNSSGSLTATAAYDAWGNPETSGGLTAYTPIGYAGGYIDSTGLIYLINRYYSPQSGQFLSLDPAVNDTQQPYVYASGDPVSITDRNGLGTCTYLKGTTWCRVVKLTWAPPTSLSTFLHYRNQVCQSGWPSPCNNHGNSKGKFIDWSSDGCSVPSWVINLDGMSGDASHPNGFPFWKACERHDFGHRNYVEHGLCTDPWYKNKLTDVQFFGDMRHGICDYYSGSRQKTCYANSDTYRRGIVDFGGC